MSEYFRSLLREAQKKEEDARLEAMLLEGLASGNDIPMTREFWKELKAEARGISAKHKTRKRPRMPSSVPVRVTTSSGNFAGI